MSLTKLLCRLVPGLGSSTDTKLRVSLETYEQLIGKSCPICNGSIRRHAYFGFASAEAGGDGLSALAVLSRLIADEDWVGAARINEWSSDTDVVVFAFLRCIRGDIAVLKVLDTSDLYIDGHADLVTMVNSAALPVVEGIVADRWDIINE